jgi:hypothetical protein
VVIEKWVQREKRECQKKKKDRSKFDRRRRKMSPHPPSPGRDHHLMPMNEDDSTIVHTNNHRVLVGHHHNHHHHKHHRHPHHGGHDMPLSPSAPELRDFEDLEDDSSSGTSVNGDETSSSGNGSSEDVGVDAGTVSLSSASSISSSSSDSEDEDYFHDAEEHDCSSSVASAAAVPNVRGELELLMLEEEEEEELVRRLSPELEALAAKELNEDPAKRAAMLRDFRAWVRTNPSMKRCRLGEFRCRVTSLPRNLLFLDSPDSVGFLTGRFAVPVSSVELPPITYYWTVLLIFFTNFSLRN